MTTDGILVLLPFLCNSGSLISLCRCLKINHRGYLDELLWRWIDNTPGRVSGLIPGDVLCVYLAGYLEFCCVFVTLVQHKKQVKIDCKTF